MIQKIVFLVFAIYFLVFLEAGSEAAIYKWKDENGKIHFTDDPNRVPEEFREDKLKFRSLPKAEKKRTVSQPRKEEEKKDEAPPLEIGENPLEPEKESKELTDAERGALESVIAFFEEDMPRYDAIYQRPLSNGNAGKRKWKVLRNTVIDTIPQKEALVEQISKETLPLLKEISGFLKGIIAKDEELKKVKPLLSDNTRVQVNHLSNRLKGQAIQEEEFLKQIEEALKPPAKSQK